MRLPLFLVVLPIARAIGQAPAPALTLRDALARAERSAYPARIAAGQAAAQRAGALAPLRGILPTVRLESGLLRTTDPIGTFGATLRQRAITAADFDPQQLNHPDPVTNIQGGVVVEQPLVNTDAWAARQAARQAADASDAAEAWARRDMRTDVIRAYYGAVLAAERARTLETAVRAAHAHLAQANAMVKNGVATRSDALLASVRASDIEAQLADATGSAATARRQLAVALGQADADLPVVPIALPHGATIRALVASDTIETSGTPRADIDAAGLGLEAARADASRAKAALLPRLNAFARYDWYSANRPFGGDRTWTLGVMASWTLIAGGSDLADVRGAAARVDVAQAAADAARARAQLEREATRSALIVALVRLDIAERAVAQSVEAHRIVARKYEGGLATVVELLDAQAIETQTALAFSQARYDAIVGDARRRQAIGADPAAVAALDDTRNIASGNPDAR